MIDKLSIYMKVKMYTFAYESGPCINNA